MTEENNAGGIAEMFAGIDFQKVVEVLPEEDRTIYKDVKTFEDVLKMNTNAQKLIGKRNENSIPGEKATPEEWKAFYKKMGADDAPNYKFEGVELPEDRLKVIQETFANNNLTKKQASEVLKKFVELDASNSKAEEEQFTKFTEEQTKERTLKYGENLSKTTNIVDHAINKLAGENKDFAEALRSLTVDNQYFEMFKKIGETLGGTDPNGPQDKNPGNKNLTPRQRIDEILDPTSKSGKIYSGMEKSTEEQRGAIQAELKELYKKIAEEKV